MPPRALSRSASTRHRDRTGTRVPKREDPTPAATYRIPCPSHPSHVAQRPSTSPALHAQEIQPQSVLITSSLVRPVSSQAGIISREAPGSNPRVLLCASGQRRRARHSHRRRIASIKLAWARHDRLRLLSGTARVVLGRHDDLAGEAPQHPVAGRTRMYHQTRAAPRGQTRGPSFWERRRDGTVERHERTSGQNVACSPGRGRRLQSHLPRARPRGDSQTFKGLISREPSSSTDPSSCR